MGAVVSLGGLESCRQGRLTNSLTILEDPFSASLCTLEESLLDDLDFVAVFDVFDVDLDVEEAALDVDEVDLDVDDVVFEDRVVLGSDISALMTAIGSWCWCER